MSNIIANQSAYTTTVGKNHKTFNSSNNFYYYETILNIKTKSFINRKFSVSDIGCYRKGSCCNVLGIPLLASNA
jgi:hypothetical protein